MIDEKEISDKWLKERGFNALLNVSYNAIETEDDVFICVDIEQDYDSVVNEYNQDVAIGLFSDGNLIPLNLYSKKEIERLYKALTGNKLSKVK